MHATSSTGGHDSSDFLFGTTSAGLGLRAEAGDVALGDEIGVYQGLPLLGVGRQSLHEVAHEIPVFPVGPGAQTLMGHVDEVPKVRSQHHLALHSQRKQHAAVLPGDPQGLQLLKGAGDVRHGPVIHRSR